MTASNEEQASGEIVSTPQGGNITISSDVLCNKYRLIIDLEIIKNIAALTAAGKTVYSTVNRFKLNLTSPKHPEAVLNTPLSKLISFKESLANQDCALTNLQIVEPFLLIITDNSGISTTNNALSTIATILQLQVIILDQPLISRLVNVLINITMQSNGYLIPF